MKTLEQCNIRFNLLTDAQKRLAIAKDALAQIKAEKYTANPGEYIRFTPWEGDRIRQFKDAQCALQDVNCQVCARGALLLSTIRKTNNLATNQLSAFPGDNRIVIGGSLETYEETIWSAEQLAMIELAFEGYQVGRARKIEYGTDEYKRCVKFGDTKTSRRSEPRTILVKILKNIVKNKGTFIP